MLISIIVLISDCQNAGRSDLQFRSLLAAISRLLPVVLPLSPHQTDGTNPAYLLGLLLVRHVTLLCQPHRLLPDEPNVSVKYVTTVGSQQHICHQAFFLTSVAEKTKTQAQNSRQKLKEKTQPQGGTFLLLRETQEKNSFFPKKI